MVLDPKSHCLDHGQNCTAIRYLEKETDALKKDLHDKAADLKEARNDIAHDMERIKDQAKQTYVTHLEFQPVKKLVYGVAALMVAEVVRRILL